MINDKINKALQTEGYKNLYDMASNVPQEPQKAVNQVKSATVSVQQKSVPLSYCTENARVLAHDLPPNILSKYRERGPRLNMSMRQLKAVTEELASNGLAIKIPIGKILLLAPTEKLYNELGLPCPYKRNVSDKHSFLILVVQALVEANPLVQRTVIEPSTGSSNDTSDLGVYLKNGTQIACELVLSLSNIAKTLAKYTSNKAYKEIWFVCRDHQLRESAWTILRDAGFEPDLFSRVRCTIISAMMRKNNNLKLEEK